MNHKHGMTGTGVYSSWAAMKARCRDEKRARYYKEKGVSICERWLDFKNFYADMGARPAGHTLDRIDNSKGYEPSNCRWADRRLQIENRSNTVWLELDGERRSQAEWSRHTGLQLSTIEQRLKSGWPIEHVLNPSKNFRYVKDGVLKVTKKHQPQKEAA